jgi:hypothetical protein
MVRAGWRERELPERPKCDKQKVNLARLLCQPMTMTLKWIAQRLHMASCIYVSNLLHE